MNGVSKKKQRNDTSHLPLQALRKGNFTDSQSQLFLEVFAFFDQDNNGYVSLQPVNI